METKKVSFWPPYSQYMSYVIEIDYAIILNSVVDYAILLKTVADYAIFIDQIL